MSTRVAVREPGPATAPAVGPVGVRERIRSLDVLRGVALLGILFVNIRLFSMPSATYLNPTLWGDFTGLDRMVWLLVHVFAEMKFLSLFSMLFGAGMCLFADRIEARGGQPGARHYRRMGWLLVFGMGHAYLLWPGDILVTYAVCGSLVHLLRRMAPRGLLLTGATLILLPGLLNTMIGVAVLSPNLPSEVAAELESAWSPHPVLLEAEVAAWRGSWSEQQPQRAAQTFEMQAVVLPAFALWFCSGAMLIGMALYRLGILQATRADRFYWGLAAIGMAGGLPFVLWGILWNFAGGWSWQLSMFTGAVFNHLGAPLMALTYLGLVMIAVRRRFLPALQERLAAIGRMAFTNYILQTVICTSIFYGHGLGLFGDVGRTSQFLIVVAIQVFQLWLSPIWLRRFSQGPLEWAWRTLTYGRLAPFRTASA